MLTKIVSHTYGFAVKGDELAEQIAKVSDARDSFSAYDNVKVTWLQSQSPTENGAPAIALTAIVEAG